MNKLILKAKNKQELDKMIKRSITLSENETFKINIIKEPKKIFFFEINGIYEVEILKKSDIKEEIKKDNKTKELKKIEKNKTKKYQEIKKEKNDTNIDKIRSFIKEFLVNSKLDIKIIKIEKINERYVVNLDGKDMRYLIGEKGSTLNSLEYLLASVKILKNIRINIDSNNYKENREKALRELARKKGQRVLETGKYLKLNPMSARERKIIHEEISYMKGLKTESQGEEPRRYLVIKPL